MFPAEVEEQLLAHPSVADAVVFGLPHERFGEVVSAMIVPVEDTEIDLGALVSHLDEHLAGYKKPRHFFVRDSLERSPTGKVELARIKADASRERDASRQGAR
ncbi:AMP-binding enzyme [Microbacterium lushaniae]|uniref:AMP-binding enzyme n=1 Tax=Microbacterium lushaniae TaxID=2614639 RepID=UPI001783AC53|nr:hypothetical protein [Microbacterium lushaniae]